MPTTAQRLAAIAAVLIVGLTTVGIAAGSNYRGLTDRPIKALSADTIRDLRDGKGMSLALAAELNGWPGPRHVLDLAGPLALTDQQRQRVEAEFTAMQAVARTLGRDVIAAEADLEALFNREEPDDTSIRRTVDRIAALQGALRYTHLRHHLATTRILTPEQTARYAALRGYETERPHEPRDGHHTIK
ncbi:MAG: periplasmic heavy metal sensor [Alphaproteobacteria bacterium]|nr:periplasmic heavy metal sensor [Alphaproteobacteria bacterium]